MHVRPHHRDAIYYSTNENKNVLELPKLPFCTFVMHTETCFQLLFASGNEENKFMGTFSSFYEEKFSNFPQLQLSYGNLVAICDHLESQQYRRFVKDRNNAFS